jgi:hypothetical protein
MPTKQQSRIPLLSNSRRPLRRSATLASIGTSNEAHKPQCMRNLDLKDHSSVQGNKIAPIRTPTDCAMWTPKPLSRSSSTVSMARSVMSERSVASDRSATSDHSTVDNSLFRGRSSSPDHVKSFAMKPEFQDVVHEDRPERTMSVSSDHSYSTLAEEVPSIKDVDLKTPRVVHTVVELPPIHYTSNDHAPISPSPPPASKADNTAGPLEQQLTILLSKVKTIEQDRPTIMAADYEALQRQVKFLELERASFLRRQEALWHCRDEDLANLIKIRGELAWLRRQHEGIINLREQDAENLLNVRHKLAKLTWASEKQQQESAMQRIMPSSGSGRASVRQSTGPGSDLWAAAKSAAMEQRVLELESVNSTLRAELDKTRANSESPRPLSRINTADDGFDRSHYRARSVAKLATLRVENETLRRDLASKEDEYMELEEKFERLQRRSGIFTL